MSPTPTSTSTDIEERCNALGLSLSRLGRLAEVSARKIWESRLSADEYRRIEVVLDAVEREVGGNK